MQILVHLKNEESKNPFKVRKRNQQKMKLLELLKKLEGDGYKINGLYGKLIVDCENKEIIDCGEMQEVHACKEFVDALYKTGGRLAVIYVDKKYIVFDNKYFIAIHLCPIKKIHPLTIDLVIENYEQLIINESSEYLNKLYSETFNRNKEKRMKAK